MLVLKGRVLGATLKKSLIHHPEVGTRILAARQFGKEDVFV